MRYGKIVDGNMVFHKGNHVIVGTRRIGNPTEAQYAAASDGPWFPVVDAPPTTPAREGCHYEAGAYELVDGKYVRCYAELADPPPPPRVFSKLKIVAALMEAGVWAQVKAYITEAGLYDLYLAAQDFKEDNPYFLRGKAALQTALGWTDEQVEAVLAASIAEGA